MIIGPMADKSNDPTLKKIFSSLLNGQFTAWPKNILAADFLQVVSRNELAPLVYYFLKKTSSLEAWPKSICSFVEQEAKRQALIEDRRQIQISQALETLATQSVPSLLFKGSALAFLNYPTSGLRPRCDTDILVHPRDVDKASRALLDLGYLQENMISGDLVSYQCAYSKTDSLGIQHVFDLHWKVSNPQLFADNLVMRHRLGRSLPCVMTNSMPS